MNKKVAHRLPDVDLLAPGGRASMSKHPVRPVRFFRGLETRIWTRYETWMSTIVDLDTGRFLGVVDASISTGEQARLLVSAVTWRLGVHVVAIDPSDALR